MHVIITGHKGRVGGQLAETFAPEHTITGLDLPEIDLAEPSAVEQIADLAPDLVIHPAAWTDVDGCARDPERALRVNAYGTKHVALACQRVGAPLVYISTNEVFDGQKHGAYLEYDRANPVNAYGYSKWVGEQLVRELLPQHYIVRISWLVAHGGRNFVQVILGRAQAGAPLRVVVDEVAAPTYNDDLAPAIAQLITTGHYGTYHLVNEGSVSRWGLARFILDHCGYEDVPIGHLTLAQYSRPSVVPPRGVLRNMAAAQLGITLRPWEEAMLAFLQKEGLAQEA